MAEKTIAPRDVAKRAADSPASPEEAPRPKWRFVRTQFASDPLEVAGKRVQFVQPVQQNGERSLNGSFETDDPEVAKGLRALRPCFFVFEQSTKGK